MESKESGVATEVVSYLTYLMAKNRLSLPEHQRAEDYPGARLLAALQAKRQWGDSGTQRSEENLKFLRQQRALPALVDECVELKYLEQCTMENIGGDEVLGNLLKRNAPFEHD